MTSVTFAAAAWSRAEVRSLAVLGTLLGRSHSFIHQDRRISIQVPIVHLDDELRPVGRGQELIALRSWESRGARLETSEYQIFSVEVAIELPEMITTPSVLLEHHPKRPDLAGEECSELLDQLMEDYHDRLHAAFEYWQAVTRWIASSSELGCSQEITLAHSDNLQFTCLRRIEDSKRFWLSGGYAAATSGTRLTPDLWDAVGKALANNEAPPVWFRYLDEAYRNGVARDLSGVILACAIACETIAREAFWISSGATNNEDARELLDRVPLRSILARWERLTGIAKGDARLGAISELFDLRNKLMHVGGRGRQLDERFVEQAFLAARAFVLGADDWYYRQRETTNPRPKILNNRTSDLWPSVRRPRKRPDSANSSSI